MPATPRTAPRSTPEEPIPRLGGVLDFMRLLWGVDHGLQSASKRMEARIGVTGPQRIAVRILGRFPAISAGRLAKILHVHPSTLTGVMRRLEERGYVVRKQDPNDARRALFSLTAKGRLLDAAQAGTVEAAVRRALGSVPERRLAAAREVLEAVARELST